MSETELAEAIVPAAAPAGALDGLQINYLHGVFEALWNGVRYTHTNPIALQERIIWETLK